MRKIEIFNISRVRNLLNLDCLLGKFSHQINNVH